MTYKNKEMQKEYQKEYRENNKDKIKEQHKKWHEKNKDKIKEYNKKYLLKNKEKIILNKQKYYLGFKDKVFNHYGWKCACCGESHNEFLTIDHIAGFGRKYVKESKMILVRWLVKNKFPPEFQILCYNCNCSNRYKNIKKDIKGNNLRAKKYRYNLRMKVFNHYGKKCACCGDNNINHLTIDHINGGGTNHRRKIGLNGSSVYFWLIKNNFPEGYQTLCYNCNCSKGHVGYCPHQKYDNKT
jgi:hypothetical protein